MYHHPLASIATSTSHACIIGLVAFILNRYYVSVCIFHVFIVGVVLVFKVNPAGVVGSGGG